MLKSLIALLLILLILSCQQVDKKIHSTYTNPAAFYHYPKIDLDYLDGVSPSLDTNSYSATIEILVHDHQSYSWLVNGKEIAPAKLLQELQQIQLSFPKEKRNRMIIDLGIHKAVALAEFIALKDSLRIGNYLNVAYLNANGQRLGQKFLPSRNARFPKIIKRPPPPPPIDDMLYLCCKEGDQYFFDIPTASNEKSYRFAHFKDCIQKVRNSEYYTLSQLEQHQFYWEGQEMGLALFADRLASKYARCSKPSRFVHVLKVDASSSFQSFFELYALCRKVYFDQWNAEAIDLFHKPYPTLSLKEKKEIRSKYPLFLIIRY